MSAAAPALWDGKVLAGVLFDLDGTLLDTLADIAGALNVALADQGMAPLPEVQVRGLIGRGAPRLVELALQAHGRPPEPALRRAVLEGFFHHYQVLEESGRFAARPYPGAADTLRILHEAALKVAVVTNKQRRFAAGLLEKLDLDRWVDLVVGGDTCDHRKPDPQPLRFACEELGLATTQVIMVGDSVNDVGAARAAGIPVVCVPYGYNEGCDPRTLDCDAMLDSLAELPGMLWPDLRVRR